MPFVTRRRRSVGTGKPGSRVLHSADIDTGEIP